MSLWPKIESENDKEKKRDCWDCIVLLPFLYLEGKTIHLEDLVVKESMRGTGLGYALYSEIIKQGKKSSAPCRMECTRLNTLPLTFL
jgi:GNAT superfamily N-acetyltransferase